MKWLCAVLALSLYGGVARANSPDLHAALSRGVATRDLQGATSAARGIRGSPLPMRCIEAWLEEATLAERAAVEVPGSEPERLVRHLSSTSTQIERTQEAQSGCASSSHPDTELQERRDDLAARAVEIERLERLAQLLVAAGTQDPGLAEELARETAAVLRPLVDWSDPAWVRVEAAVREGGLPEAGPARWPGRTRNVTRGAGGLAALSALIALAGAVARPLFTGRDPRPWSAVFGGFFFGSFATIISGLSYYVPPVAFFAAVVSAGVLAVGTAVLAKADTPRRRHFAAGILTMGTLGALLSTGGFMHMRFERRRRETWRLFVLAPQVGRHGGGLSLATRW